MVGPRGGLPSKCDQSKRSRDRRFHPGLGYRTTSRLRAAERLGLLAPIDTARQRSSGPWLFPIGIHFTGLPTLSTGGAGARFGVCANAGDARSTSTYAAFFIPTLLFRRLGVVHAGRGGPVRLSTVEQFRAAGCGHCPGGAAAYDYLLLRRSRSSLQWLSLGQSDCDLRKPTKLFSIARDLRNHPVLDCGIASIVDGKRRREPRRC